MNKKRSLSMILAVFMLFTLVMPVGAGAEEFFEEPYTEDFYEEPYTEDYYEEPLAEEYWEEPYFEEEDSADSFFAGTDEVITEDFLDENAEDAFVEDVFIEDYTEEVEDASADTVEDLQLTLEDIATFEAGNVKPTIDTPPSDTTAAMGQMVTFSVKSSNADSYQWQILYKGKWVSMTNDSVWLGNKTDTLQFTATKANLDYQYRCVLTNAYGTTETDPVVYLEADNVKPIIDAQPIDTAAGLGQMVTFSVKSSNADSYQWQILYKGKWSSMTNDSVWLGNKTDTLQFTATKANLDYQYRCVLTNAFGTTETDPVVFTTNVKPTIDTPPSNTIAAIGQMVTFSVKSSNADSYQWQILYKGKWNNMTNDSVWLGNKTDTLSFTATNANAEYEYRCVLTNAYGTTETESVVFYTSGNEKPTIDTPPSDTEAAIGQMVTFTVESSNADSYQWQILYKGKWSSMTNDSVWLGNKTDTLSFIATNANATYQYRCVLTNAFGTTETDPVVFTVSENLKPVIDTPPSDTEAAIGQMVTFSVKSSNADSYQWQILYKGKWSSMTNDSVWFGNKTDTLSFTATNANATYQYRCVLTNAHGTTETDAVVYTVSSNVMPTIDVVPSNTAAALGDLVTFTVKSDNADGYQWQILYKGKWSSMTNDSVWFGNKTDTLSFTATRANAEYQYRCVLTNAYGTTETEPVTFTLVAKPTIDTQPVNTTAAVGQTVTFTVKSSNTDSYQWQILYKGKWSSMTNDSVWLGNKTDTLSFTATNANVEYQYRCVLTNADGSTETEPVVFTLVAPTEFISEDVTYEIIDSTHNVRVKLFDNNEATTVSVPGTVKNPYDGDDYIVTEIGVSAFENKDKITSVTLPNSITVIAAKAFKGCTSLSTMNAN